MTEIDKHIENYTIQEMLTILDLEPDEIDSDNIMDSTNEYIDRFEKERNDEMAQFFLDMQEKLLEYLNGIEENENEEISHNIDSNFGKNNLPTDIEYNPAQEQTDMWFKNQSLNQNDAIQKDKVTDRVQKIEVYNNTHVPMKQEQLGVNNNFNVPVAQDKLNPNLENVTKRFINLDSKYRQVTGLNNLSTDYTCDLSDPLFKVLSLKLYSFQIPYSWYVIDTYNSCFWISLFKEPETSGIDIDVTEKTPILFPDLINPNIVKPGVPISIKPGNYTPDTFTRALTAAIKKRFDQPNDQITWEPVTYEPATGKLILNLLGGQYKEKIDEEYPIIDESSIITFFDFTGTLMCPTLNNSQSFKINNTLGWIMGYRLPHINVSADGNEAPAILDLYGPKYLIIALDDYNQNHINNGLIGITEYNSFMKVPSYYSPDMKNTIIPPNYGGLPPYTPNERQTVEQNGGIWGQAPINSTNINAGLLMMDKLSNTYSARPNIVPTSPRTLTQSQIYSINQIMKNNENTATYRLAAPTTTDTFAILPVKHGGMSIGDLYVEFSGSLQDNKRVYFGPVSIDRLHITLLDDKGNILNLNGLDWSITLISENLYQY